MDFIPYDESHSQEWDDFCLSHPQAWYWHTTLRMKHCINRQFNSQAKNVSMMMRQDGKWVGLIPLLIDDYKQGEKIFAVMNYGGWGTPMPLVSPDLSVSAAKRLMKKIFDQIDVVAAQYNVVYAQFLNSFPPQFFLSFPQSNLLLEYGFLDTSLATQIINLKKSDEILWKELSENHQRAIKQAQKKLKIQISQGPQTERSFFDAFVDSYFKNAGKVTRPQVMYDLMYQMIFENNGLIACATHQDRPVGYVVTVVYKKMAYYLNGVNEKDFEECPVAHFLHWEIMRYLKEREVEYYESGIQQFGLQWHDFPSQKDLDISRFKKGFGGVTFPRYAGEKFYNKDFARSFLSARSERLVSAICEEQN